MEGIKVRELDFYTSKNDHPCTLGFGKINAGKFPVLFAHGVMEAKNGEKRGSAAACDFISGWFHPGCENLTGKMSQLAIYTAETAKAICSGEMHPFQAVHLLSPSVHQKAKELGLSPLAANLPLALVERVFLGGLGEVYEQHPLDLIKKNDLGNFNIGEIHPDLRNYSLSALVNSKRAPFQYFRHTVGVDDALLDNEVPEQEREPLVPGSQVSLEGFLKYDGIKAIKVKFTQDMDVQRLMDIGTLAKMYDVEIVTLDANQTFSVDGAKAAYNRINIERKDHAGLSYLWSKAIAFEQPWPLEVFANPSDRLRSVVGYMQERGPPIMIDESDVDFHSWKNAYDALGVRLVSRKGCKGTFKALLNKALMDYHHIQGADVFGEDLTCNEPWSMDHERDVESKLMGFLCTEKNGHVKAIPGTSCSEREINQMLISGGWTWKGDVLVMNVEGNGAYTNRLDGPNLGYGIRFDPECDKRILLN